MANFKQQIADTHEYAKLISETLISEVTQLQELDKNTNQLGKTAIKLSELTGEISDNVKHNKEALLVGIENQEQIQNELTVVSEKVDNLKTSIAQSQDSVETLAESVLMVSNQQYTVKEDIVNVVNENNETYVAGVETLNETMLSVFDAIKTINYTEDFTKIEERIADTNEALIKTNDENEARHNELIDRLLKVSDEITNVTKFMSDLNEQNEEIQADIKLAIARANSIETKLEAVVASDDVVMVSQATFADELAELNATLEQTEQTEQTEATN